MPGLPYTWCHSGTLYVTVDFSLGNARNPFRSWNFELNEKERSDLAKMCSDLAKVLIECGANVNSQDMNNWTPLHFASKSGYLGTAQLLLDHGADANALDNNHVTPIHLALQHGHLEIAQLLLLHGANQDSRDKDSRTPLHLVSQWYTLCLSQFQFR
jgi:ankyrin repeat protein